MGNFNDDIANAVANAIIDGEKPKIDTIMRTVADNIRQDFANETIRLIDKYYDSYVPINYVRLYGPKRTLRTKSGKTKRHPKRGGISLHAAIMRISQDPNYAFSIGDYDHGYQAGIVFDSEYCEDNNHIRHMKKGKNFSEWNIIENFLFAGEGHYGDVRSYPEISGVEYTEPSADEELKIFINNYKSTFDKHYKNALKNS